MGTLIVGAIDPRRGPPWREDDVTLQPRGPFCYTRVREDDADSVRFDCADTISAFSSPYGRFFPMRAKFTPAAAQTAKRRASRNPSTMASSACALRSSPGTRSTYDG